MKGAIFIFAALFAVALCDHHLFRNADLNYDEVLVEAEFDNIFMHYDSNGDKKVDQYEFTVGLDRDDWGDDDKDPRIAFHMFDVNDDGFIAPEPDLKHLFKVFDTDADTRVTKLEFKKSWDALFDD